MYLILGLLALFFLPGSAVAFWQGVKFIAADPVRLKYLLIGTGAGTVIYLLLLRRWQYLLTFEHELTHAIMALMFFRRIEKFVVTRYDGGVVYHSGGFGGEFGNVVIQMAPYFFPTFTIIALLFQPLIPPAFVPWYIGLIGFTIVFHILSTIREIISNWTSDSFTEANSSSTRQTDIASAGFVFSLIFIPATTLFIYGFVFWFLKYSYSCFFPFMKEILGESFQLYNAVFSWLIGLLR